ncbi:hypothetical protein WA026_001704 [Henosepilachna vigintioctopunctata]|uniref:Uncharacterized protein n=1 Tax=Henosepilachna vigintioctopunctata TaxID=420089 RepID=A0AAW1UVD1_9CUCU
MTFPMDATRLEKEPEQRLLRQPDAIYFIYMAADRYTAAFYPDHGVIHYGNLIYLPYLIRDRAEKEHGIIILQCAAARLFGSFYMESIQLTSSSGFSEIGIGSS